MTRRRRRLLDAIGLALCLATSALVTDAAQARDAVPFGAAGVNVDLNIASLIVASSTALAGILGYLRLRTERPKIVAEVGKLNEERDAKLEERLRTALEAAWAEVDRCREEIGHLRGRERELEDRVEVLERGYRAAGLELP